MMKRLAWWFAAAVVLGCVVLGACSGALAHELKAADGTPIPHQHFISKPGPNNDVVEEWDGIKKVTEYILEDWTPSQQAEIEAKQVAQHPGITPVKPATQAYDCHGLTFSGGTVWINDGDVQEILNGQGYSEVTGKAQVGDIVVYKVAGSIKHTGIVTEVDGAGNVTKVRSKWGDTGEYEHAPNNVPAHYGTPTVFRNGALYTPTPTPTPTPIPSPTPTPTPSPTPTPAPSPTPTPTPIDIESEESCTRTAPAITGGGIAEPIVLGADSPASSSGSSRDFAAPIAAVAGVAGVLAVAAGGWYVSRRWLR